MESRFSEIVELREFGGVAVKMPLANAQLICVSERHHVLYWIYLCGVFRMRLCYLLDRKLFLYSYDIVKLLHMLYFTPFAALMSFW